MTQSKQEEFLERLKDPLKAKLIDAVKEFRAAYPNVIHDVVVFKEPSGNTYYIDVYAKNPAILADTRKSFIETIDKYLPENTWINDRSHDDEYQHGLYRHSYFIDLLPKSAEESLIKQLAHEITESIDEEIIKALQFPPK